MISRRHLLWAGGAWPLAAQPPKPAPENSAAPSTLRIDPALMPEIPAEPPRPAAEAPPPLRGAQWKIRYFLDELDQSLNFTAFVSPAPEFALASGIVRGARRGRPQNLGVASRDGGANWSEIKLPAPAASLFALDPAHVWLVSGNRLYFSDDGAAKWSRLRLPRRMARVHFLTPLDGFAFGFGKTFYRTADGGRTWSEVPESAKLPLTDENTVFRSMAFVGGRVGLLAGNSRRPVEDDRYLPDWMMPERALGRRPRPATTVFLSTLDGGATWKPSITSAFGDVIRVRLRGRHAAALFDYGEGFPWPSEVMHNDLTTGKNEPYFRRRGLPVHDLLLLEGDACLLALIEPFGKLPGAGLPGRLRLVWSPDGKQWFQMPADYRAQGPSVLLAGQGESLFAAMSNGMILRMEK